MAADTPAFATTENVEALLKDTVGRWSLDRPGSSVQFHVKHFWGAITVHGRFETLEGEGRVDPDGRVSGP